MKTEEGKKTIFNIKKNSNNLEELYSRSKARNAKKNASYTNEI